ncbi:FAD:protein FMN transferase [Salipiger mucosus]|uniref:FAD:protein FMN transferase n=1 Tax=Salipiger mucosus DSM 16094 TaxID=1123237 RepID=S9Q5P1_9RHOB|nr:FAD:protein FMN transferase [Salipiger mucosus]EPX76676.1 Thiamin biosynthesis lipoprotein ApbE [Salipiger mucosus DSM 16094]
MAQAGSHPDRRRVLLGGCAALASGLGAPLIAGAPATETLRGRAFGTDWSVSLPGGAARPGLGRQLSALLAGIDREMSPWRADSTLSALNRAGAGAQGIGPELATVTGAALSLAETTGGLFDPTLGPAVARWGFGPIDTAAETGWRGLLLDGEDLHKAEGALTLDLCGIAKGRALDRMGAHLAAEGAEAHFIAFGGEVLAAGRHPSGRAWRVGVEQPLPGDAGLYGRVALADAAIATSGIKANSYLLGARRYSHIIDSGTLRPVAGDLLSVSVRARTAMEADGWATALMAAGDGGPGVARQNGVDALFLFGGAGALRAEVAGRFALERG